MPIHTVVQGECLSSLGARCGLSAEGLHDHPDNAELKQKRPYPNILAPGDEVVLPETDRKTESVATGRVHLFKLNRKKVKIRIVLLNAYGKPYAGSRYTLTAGSTELNGTTTSAGLIEGEIPAEEQCGQLRAWLTDDDEDPDPHIDRSLDIGHLDPIDMISGVQARLTNLGYFCDVTGESDDATLIAAHRFRARNGLLRDDDDDSDDGEADTREGPESANTSDDDAPGDDAQDDNEPDDETPDDDSPDDETQSTEPEETPIDDPLRAKLQGLYEAR
jgi:N-acetylmuramoyl-L-alanine amidase